MKPLLPWVGNTSSWRRKSPPQFCSRWLQGGSVACGFNDVNAQAGEVLMTERLRDGMRSELSRKGIGGARCWWYCQEPSHGPVVLLRYPMVEPTFQ